MKKVRIKANILDVKEIFENLTSIAGFPEGPEVKVDLSIDDTVENYKYLCSSPLVSSWEFIEEEDKKELAYTLDPQFYDDIKRDFEASGINMKDLRDIIMISYSYYCVSKMSLTPNPQVPEIIKYYLVNKDRIKEKVYSEEFISNTILGMSGASNILLDYLDRVKESKDLVLRDDVTFEVYYKSLYNGSKE